MKNQTGGENSMIKLNKNEKKVACIEFADYLPELRNVLHLTQSQFGDLCGISTDRLSRIENKHAVMTWSQYTSVLFLCMMNLDAKEFVFANHLIAPSILRFFQQKPENIPPVINICIHEEIEKEYINRYKRKDEFHI